MNSGERYGRQWVIRNEYLLEHNYNLQMVMGKIAAQMPPLQGLRIGWHNNSFQFQNFTHVFEKVKSYEKKK